MECGLDFTRHLHNGDPLIARTVRAPAGRLVDGRPGPQTSDALRRGTGHYLVGDPRGAA